jgi:hypothetical protein
MDKKMNRRGMLQATGLMAAGAVSGCALPVVAEDRPATPFAVARTMLPIVGSSEQFPVRRIYCIGRNYAAHAREMGSDPTRELPFFFQKPTDAVQYVAPGSTGAGPQVCRSIFSHDTSQFFPGTNGRSWKGKSTSSARGRRSCWTSPQRGRRIAEAPGGGRLGLTAEPSNGGTDPSSLLPMFVRLVWFA